MLTIYNLIGLHNIKFLRIYSLKMDRQEYYQNRIETLYFGLIDQVISELQDFSGEQNSRMFSELQKLWTTKLKLTFKPTDMQEKANTVKAPGRNCFMISNKHKIQNRQFKRTRIIVRKAQKVIKEFELVDGDLHMLKEKDSTSASNSLPLNYAEQNVKNGQRDFDNSSDDQIDEEEDVHSLLETKNNVYCLFDKIVRVRNKTWRFHLRSGIINISGKDYCFRKSFGEAEW